MNEQMYRVALASRPSGPPTSDNFRYEAQPMPVPGAGEVLVRVRYLSLDPYMRGVMDDVDSYTDPVPLGGTMEGGVVGEVIISNSADFKPGDIAVGWFGWASHGCLPAAELRKVDPDQAPITTTLGVLGMPGFTGWYGLKELGRPKSGETLVVASATGPVGSMVGQMAKLAGMRTIAIAGGAEKCALAKDRFGFDAAIDHRAFDDAGSLRKALAIAAPDGVDIYFENVGGKVLEAVLPLMNRFGRIPLCGMISTYNLGEALPPGPDHLPSVWGAILVKHLTVTGFIISNHFERYPEFLAEVAPRVASGEIAYLEDIAEGLENAPEAFMSMLSGGNMGKQVVKVA